MTNPPEPDDQERTALRIVVVGGGASGVLVAARVLDASFVDAVHVTIVEPGNRLAAGVAYGTDDPEHLLNVRASGMSADPSHPDDLVDWLERRGDGGPDTFLPRRDYRTYLQEHLSSAAARSPRGRLEVRRDRVTGVSVGHEATVRLASGDTIDADHVVLATGNSSPGVPPSLQGLEGHPSWVPDPWAPAALEPHLAAERVVLVGTGLTMVDLAITLSRSARERGTTQELLALSRHGLVPMHHLAHQPSRPIDVIDLDRDSADVLALRTRVVARTVDHVGAEYPDEDWREVIDAIRPYANGLWQRFDEQEQRCFLSQVAREWDVHRHRMSPPTAARLGSLLDDGRLRVALGEVLEASPGAAGEAQLRLVVDGQVQDLQADVVVNCTGPGRSWLPPANPVVTDLVDQGLAVPEVHGLGLATAPTGCLLDARGRAVARVHVIGPPRRGGLIETTAIPELRSQALHIADRLVIGV